MLDNFKNKYNERKKIIKSYLVLINDFSKLNKYIFLSNKCLNRLEIILFSDLPDEIKLNNIEIIYSDFKNDFETSDFLNGVKVINNFDRGGNNND